MSESRRATPQRLWPKILRACRTTVVLGVVGLMASVSSAMTTTLIPATPNPTDSAGNRTALLAEIDAATARNGPTTIRLRKGHSFLGTFTLKNKTLDNAYTIIESEGIQDGSLPAAGVRVAPGDATNMAKILGPSNSGSAYAFITEASAHHYVLRGLEMVKINNSSHSGLMKIGDDTSAQDELAEVPHHIEVDRCYMHAFDNNHEMFRHIYLASGHTIVSNCYLSDAKSLPTSGDSQSIGANNGTGPFWIVNNYMEGASENFMIGGGGAHLPDTVPGNPNIISDVTFKRNHCFKPLSWRPDIDPATGHPIWQDPGGSAARNWNIKNLFELKMGRRVDIQGNVFENCWGQYAGQAYAICFKNTKNSITVSANELLTHDVLFKYNRVAHASAALGTEGRFYSNPQQQYGPPLPPNLRRVTIEHNLLEDITPSTVYNGPGWGYMSASSRGSFYAPSHAGYDIRVQHNTCFNTGGPVLHFGGDYQHQNLVVSNNVVNGDAADTIYGNNSATNTTRGDAAVAVYTDPAFPMAFNHNAIMTPTTPSNITGTLFTNNWWPQSWTAGVILVNQASGNYNVVNPSTYWTNLSPGDGTPIGADLYTSSTDTTSVSTMTANCDNGNWTAKDIVLYAKDATVKSSHWTVVSDPLSAGGGYLQESNDGTAKQTDPLASPTSYFEMTFTAQANVPYHLWIRGRAPSDQTASDSVHVQFTNTIASIGGAAAYRIGTGGAGQSIEWVLQNGSASINGWGWRDSKWGTTVAEKQVIFATSGTQTIRLQRREDGVQIDQILLSPATYLGRGPVDANPEVAAAQANPGSETSDTTILTRTAAPQVNVTLKNGVNGYAGSTAFYVSGASATTHFGPGGSYMTANTLSGTNGSVLRMFYKFDVSSIPGGATIDSATLRLKTEFVSNTTNYGISCYQMAPFNVFTVNYATATRNTYDGTNGWSGGSNAAGNTGDNNNDYLDTAVSNIAIPAVGQYMEFNVTSSVQAWVNGTANNGWLIYPNAGANNISVRTGTPADSGGSADYPELVITYH